MILQKDNFRIVLASKSPRRSQLLEQAGLPFVVKTREVEETYPDNLIVEEVPVYLAKKKAAESIDFIEKENDILLTADSVVILDAKIYGKPKDAADAKSMLQQLSGREHKVVTGVCLRTHDKEVAFGDLTTVKFAPLSDEEIDYYIEKYQPYDKAGSYAIQEWIGLCKIEQIKGTYANVMGLPVQTVWKKISDILD